MKAHGERSAVKSMTGFARVASSFADAEIEVEIRSVNHRFFEVSVRGPRALGVLEREMRGILQRDHRRGRFDISVSRRVNSASSDSSNVDYTKMDEVVSAYVAACKRYGAGAHGLPNFISEVVLRDAAVVADSGEVSESEMDHLREVVLRCSQLVQESRAAEGAQLVADIEARLSGLDRMREAIAQQVAGGPNRWRERITERLRGLAPEISLDADRLALEVAMLADRVDVSEELSRLDIHLRQFEVLLRHGDPQGVGRKLDFMVQEIGRELNTIGSKAQDADVQGIVVEAKAELERVREQVQNIE
jgi:uncharacterized protein (TIGR00255 family)